MLNHCQHIYKILLKKITLRDILFWVVIFMTIYERIRQLRIDNNMSQDDLARAMGYKDRSMITKIESGKVDISQKKIIAFSKVLGTTPAYLMGWSDSGPAAEPDAPKTLEARIVSGGMDKLPKEQREQILNVVRAMFAQHPELFDKKDD